MLLTKVYKAAILMLLLVVLSATCNELREILEEMMDFKIDASKTYTNVITQSVGPTTSLASRALVDTDTSHYIYLDATNGNDGNAGFPTPADAKATFAAAFGARTGARQVIQILDSSTYTLAVAYNFNASASSGIQADLGQTPILNITTLSSANIQLSPTGATPKMLCGCIVIKENLGGLCIAKTGANGLVTIKDNYIYNKYSGPPIWATGNCFKDAGTQGNIHFKNNICVANGSYTPIWIQSSTNEVLVNNNIVYLNIDPVDGNQSYNYLDAIAAAFAYVGNSPSLVLDFDQPTLVATIDGTSTVTSFTPDAWVGYVVDMTGSGGFYKITGNSSTQLFLEDKFDVGSGSLSNVLSIIWGEHPEAGIYAFNDLSGNQAITIKRNIVIGKNHKAGIVLAGGTTLTTNVATVEGNVVLNCENGIVASAVYPQSTSNIASVLASENILYSSVAAITGNLALLPSTADAGVTITSAPYSNKIVPLYFNQQNALIAPTVSPYVDATLGYVKSAYDFRLRQKGKKYTTDSDIMILDSPLLELYTAPAPDEDLNPWEETLVAGALTYASTVNIKYPPKQLAGSFNPRNPVEIMDLLGNPAIDFDSQKKEFAFSWQQNYTENLVIWKLQQIKEDKGIKQWYPLGINKSLMTNLSGSNLSGALVAATKTFTPAALPFPMIPKHWKGWWITFDSKSFYISDNTASAFTLIDKLGVGFPADASYEFTIEYMLVQVRPTALAFNQSDYTSFRKGGQWQEQDDLKGHIYTGPSIVLIEAENSA